MSLRHLWFVLRCRELFRRYASKEAFLLLVYKTVQTNTDYLIVKRTYTLSEEVFAGKRRESGEPYMVHNHAVAVILMVFGKCRDPELIAAALLHDLMEEYPDEWTRERIERLFTPRIARIVDECTVLRELHIFDSEEERLQFYFRRIWSSEKADALKVKICDRIHNLFTIRVCGPARAKKKAKETRTSLLDQAKEINFLADELEAAVELTEHYAKKNKFTLMEQLARILS